MTPTAPSTTVHGSEQAREIAEAGTILRVRVGQAVQLGSGLRPGSGSAGAAVVGQDDLDEMGICLEPPAFVTGTARVPVGTAVDGRTVPFEQYERRTAWDAPGGFVQRPGEGDLVVYSARKWCRLALAGHPTMLLALFVPDEQVVLRTAAGAELVAHADRFVSRLAGEQFLGHIQSHRAAMTGEIGDPTDRPEQMEVHGYDTAHAMHALRLGVQGVELLGTGRITLPVPEPWLSYLRAVDGGDVALAEVLAAVDEVAAELIRLTSGFTVPDRPDTAWVDGWLHRSHLEFWSATTA